jgi:hypothetical protein
MMRAGRARQLLVATGMAAAWLAVPGLAGSAWAQVPTAEEVGPRTVAGLTTSWIDGYPYVNNAGTAVTINVRFQGTNATSRALTILCIAADTNTGHLSNCGSTATTRSGTINQTFSTTYTGVASGSKVWAVRICDEIAGAGRPSCGSTIPAAVGPDVVLQWPAQVASGSCGLESLRAAWAGGTLKVAFRDRHAYTAAYNVRWPDPGTNSWTPLGTVTLSNAVAGYPTWYEATFSVPTAPSPLSVRVAKSDAMTCAVAAALGSDLDAVHPDGVGTGEDPDDGGSCGLNPFCHVKAALKWAFVPSESKMTEAKALTGNLLNKAPWGYGVKAGAWWVEVLDHAKNCAEAQATSCGSGGEYEISFDVFPADNGGDVEVEILGFEEGSPVFDALQQPAVRLLLEGAMWALVLVPFGIWLVKSSLPTGGGDA